LDSTEGLLLGQHVYIRLAGVNSGSTDRVLMPESYLMDIRYDEQTMIHSASIWCPDEEGKLVRQEVVLGEYVSGCYVILEGLTLEGYVADPSNPDCREGALADQRSEQDYQQKVTVTGETPCNEDEGSFSGETGESSGEEADGRQDQTENSDSGHQDQNGDDEPDGDGDPSGAPDLEQEEDMGSWS
jgi:hypothetical protein